MATYIALLLADIPSDGVEIEGVGTWILSTIIVWVGTLIYDLIDDKVIAMIGQRVGGAGRSAA